MVDVVGTRNLLKWASQIQSTVQITTTPTDISLPSITLPNIPNATIVRARLNMSYRVLLWGNNQATPSQYIQIRKDTPGSWINAILLPAFNTVNENGDKIKGTFDVISEVDAFNDTYEIQWDNAVVNVSVTNIQDVFFELEVWYTLDSGIEAKIDIIDTEVGVIDGIVDDIKEAIIVGSGTVQLNGSQTVLQTDLSDADDFWNDLQILMISGNNAGETRRISDFVNVNGVVTVDTGFKNNVLLNDTFILIGRFTSAASALTPSTIATAVWSEVLPGSFTGSMAGKIIADIGTRVLAVFNKIPSKSYLRGTADADGGFDTEDKADIEAECGDALAVYDPPTKAELDTAEANIIVEIDANEVKIDTVITNLGTLSSDLGIHDTDIKALMGTPAVDLAADIASIVSDLATHDADIKARLDIVDTNIQANYDAIILIQNNVSTVLTGPKKLVRPDAGTKPYRYFVFNYDNVGNMEDFNADPTLTGTYVSGGGPYFGGTMTRDGIGQYHFDVNVAYDDTLGAVQVKLDAVVAGTLAPRVMTITSEVSDFDDELQEIFDLVEETHTKVDAATPSPTIPEQLTTMETNLTAEIDENQVIVETIRDDMEAEITFPNPAFIGSGYSNIDSENPIAIGATTIPLLPNTGETFNPDGGSIKLSKGEVEEESIVYTGIVDDVVTLYTPTANELQPNASVYEVTKLNFHMTIRKKDGDVNIQADSLPTYSVGSVIVGLGGLPDGSGSMTWEAAPARYVATVEYDIDTEPSQRVGMIDVIVDSKTRDFTFDFELMERPSTERQINEAVGSAIPPNTIVFDHDGWIDEFGVKHLWTDLMKGAIKDDAGQPVVLNIKAYLYDPVDVNTPILGPNPPYDNWTNQFGHYVGGLPAGKYLFTFIANGKKWKQVDRYIDYP